MAALYPWQTIKWMLLALALAIMALFYFMGYPASRLTASPFFVIIILHACDLYGCYRSGNVSSGWPSTGYLVSRARNPRAFWTIFSIHFISSVVGLIAFPLYLSGFIGPN
jgi:hypothetical protein